MLDALALYESGDATVADLQASAAGAAGALDNANADLQASLERLDADLETVRFAVPEDDEKAAVAAATADLRRLIDDR